MSSDSKPPMPAGPLQALIAPILIGPLGVGIEVGEALGVGVVVNVAVMVGVKGHRPTGQTLPHFDPHVHS